MNVICNVILEEHIITEGVARGLEVGEPQYGWWQTQRKLSLTSY